MVAMVSIETPGFRPKRWWTLDKNFLFPSTMSLNHGKDQIFVWEKLRKCNHDLKFYFWGKSAFFCNNMVAMVSIETPGFRPKRWWTLDKNFLFPSTMSLNHGKDQIFVWEKLRKCNHDLKFYFWGKSAFFCNNMVAMVSIETPGFRPKRWWTLDKNFLFPSTMSLNHGKDQIFV